MAMQRFLPLMGLLTTLLLAAGTAVPVVRADNDPGPLKFKWAFVGYSEEDTGGELVRIDRDISLKSGDRFKFYFEMKQNGYAYLITLSSQADLHLLFPQSLRRYDIRPAAGTYYIPSGNNWFQLDDQKGQERFYLLVSAERLLEMESLFKGYETAAGAQKAAYRDSVLSEIRRLRWKYRKFKKPAERPVAVMGQTRGVKKAALPGADAVSKLATPVEADNFFSRTFTIDHQ